jgi:hypothetical protein
MYRCRWGRCRLWCWQGCRDSGGHRGSHCCGRWSCVVDEMKKIKNGTGWFVILLSLCLPLVLPASTSSSSWIYSSFASRYLLVNRLVSLNVHPNHPPQVMLLVLSPSSQTAFTCSSMSQLPFFLAIYKFTSCTAM